MIDKISTINEFNKFANDVLEVNKMEELSKYKVISYNGVNIADVNYERGKYIPKSVADRIPDYIIDNWILDKIIIADSDIPTISEKDLK